MASGTTSPHFHPQTTFSLQITSAPSRQIDCRTTGGLPKCTPYPQPREVDGVPFLTCIKGAFPLMCSSLCFASWICGHLDIWRLLLNHPEPRMVLGKTLSIISLVHIVFFHGWNRHS